VVDVGGEVIDPLHGESDPLVACRAGVKKCRMRRRIATVFEDPASEFLPIRGLNVALDERDPITNGHCDRVSGLALAVGHLCGLSEHELQILRLVARLHDIGKIGIPDVILKKPTKLDDQDWVIMRTHSARSERIVLASTLEDGAEIAQGVRHHHERYDGHGYPDGLAGESIPIVSRIVAIADTYDAMARLRTYGAPLAHAEIMRELQRVAGGQHDAYLSAKFSVAIESSVFKVNGH
jgi:HD-GYP domain-containing protein (c-di-GMP phosphodiesterase class II)